MKTKIFLPILIAVLASCDGKDDPEYIPADTPAEAQRVHFAAPKETKLVSADATSFNVYLYRPENKQAGELTVQLTVTDPDGLFTFPEAVKFAAGEHMASVTVGYDVSNMTPNHPYTTYIAIDQVNADLYGETTLELVINYEVMSDWALFGAVADTDKNGLATWTLASIFAGNVIEGARIMERHIPSNPDVIEFEMQLFDGEDLASANPGDPYDSEMWMSVMNFSTADGGKTITVPAQTFALDPSVKFADAHTLYPDMFEPTSHWNDITGTFTLNIMYFDASGAWNPGDETVTLNGYPSRQ